MRQTKNRAAILKCLTEPNEDCGGSPPYSASSIEHMLSYGFAWYGAARPVSVSQINRTLRDLLADGLIVGESRLDEGSNGALPQRVNYWQVAGHVARNKLLNEVVNVCRTASKAHGTFLFNRDSFFDKPMDDAQKAVIIKDLKSLMQRTHPDKADGYTEQFTRINEALAYVRSNVDLLKEPGKRLT